MKGSTWLAVLRKRRPTHTRHSINLIHADSVAPRSAPSPSSSPPAGNASSSGSAIAAHRVSRRPITTWNPFRGWRGQGARGKPGACGTSSRYHRHAQTVAGISLSASAASATASVYRRRHSHGGTGLTSAHSLHFAALARHFGFHSLASLCASAICSGVIFAATVSRFLTALPRFSTSV